MPLHTMAHGDVDDRVNEISGTVVDECIHVHRSLGPGLYEWVYQECLRRRLEKRGLRAAIEVQFPAIFDGERLDAAFRVDLDVEETVLVELKAVPILEPAHFAQVRTYLKTSGREVGLLVNFHAPRVIDGMHRILARPSWKLRDSEPSAPP